MSYTQDRIAQHTLYAILVSFSVYLNSALGTLLIIAWQHTTAAPIINFTSIAPGSVTEQAETTSKSEKSANCQELFGGTFGRPPESVQTAFRDVRRCLETPRGIVQSCKAEPEAFRHVQKTSEAFRRLLNV